MRVNVRALRAMEALPDSSVSEEWINKWAVDFVEKPDTATSLQNSQSGGQSETRYFYPSSAAFSSSFEDFAKSLVSLMTRTKISVGLHEKG